MKNLRKFLLLTLSFLALNSTAFATSASSKFDGRYFSPGPSGIFDTVEARIYGTRIYGTAFLKDGGSFWFYYDSRNNLVDAAGNIKGRFYDQHETRRNFTGRVAGGLMILTFQTKSGPVLGYCVLNRGYAPAFLAGQGVYFSSGGAEYTVYCYDGYAYVYIYSGGGYTYNYITLAYRRTGANTGVVTIPGIGSVTLTYSSLNYGTIVGTLSGSPVNTYFYDFDLADD